MRKNKAINIIQINICLILALAYKTALKINKQKEEEQNPEEKKNSR